MGKERDLDRALGGSREAIDPEIERLLDTSEAVRSALAVEVPADRSTGAFFARAVAARRRGIVVTRTVAASTLLAAAVLLAVMARGALPGDTLYPVRQVMGGAGLARSSTEEVSRRIQAARTLLDAAVVDLTLAPDRAEREARDALVELGIARALLADISDPTAYAGRIAALEKQAFAVIRTVPGPRLGPRPEASPNDDDDGGDDRGRNRGRGSDDDTDGRDDRDDDDDGGDDNSGPGSDDTDDDLDADSGGDGDGSGDDD